MRCIKPRISGRGQFRETHFLHAVHLVCTCIPALAQSTKPAEPMKADRVLNLWPDTAPQWQAPRNLSEIPRDGWTRCGGRPVIRLGNVTVPQLHWYQAETDAANADTVILVCPAEVTPFWPGTLKVLKSQNASARSATPQASSNIECHTAKWRTMAGSGTRHSASHQLGAFRTGHPKKRQDSNRLGGIQRRGNAAARVATAPKRWYEPIDKVDESPRTRILSA